MLGGFSLSVGAAACKLSVEGFRVKFRLSVATMMEEYLQASEIIDWQHPTILELAQKIASGHQTSDAIAKACFEWVRDQIRHSYDEKMNPITCRASDVLQYKTGYCYAKSHLLAALLRAQSMMKENIKLESFYQY